MRRQELIEDFGWHVRNALLGEVYTTPKPGLVDRQDNGSHRDMTFETFIDSTEAITPYIVEMFLAGFDGVSVLSRAVPGYDPALTYSEAERIFLMIRVIGMNADRAMFTATHGVNTHKGMIFTMGIVSAAAGLEYRSSGRFDAAHILETSAKMTRRILQREFAEMQTRAPRTHGEILYHQYGEKGIRGQAELGFPIIRETALPAMERAVRIAADDKSVEQLRKLGTIRRELTQQDSEQNREKLENLIHLEVLLEIMAVLNDTNVASRSSYMEMQSFKKEAAAVLQLGGAFTEEGFQALEKMNQDCIRRNISPGGAADILAVTILLHRLVESMV
ncbi:MAG: triphosphoribosyl-dephospho-CoA synthase [Oribacterium sp.]|nr:triphosphoribosyl-dephospho-CoA synthase [Oribacterium sp.]